MSQLSLYISTMTSIETMKYSVIGLQEETWASGLPQGGVWVGAYKKCVWEGSGLAALSSPKNFLIFSSCNTI